MDPASADDQRLSLRERKKLQTMRRIQTIAIDMIQARSYDDVTIEEIADRAEVSPSTVYRHFATKEGIFLWDEYDAPVIGEFMAHVAEQGPIESMTDAIDHVMSQRFHLDRDRVLGQLRLIDEVGPLRQAAAAGLDELRQRLTTVLADSGWSRLDATVAAGAIVSAFQGAIDVWVANDGDGSLTELFGQALGLVGAGLDSRR